jgi:hypothetical protein
MIRRFERQRKSKEIAERREKEALEGIAKYRNLIPRGDWTPLRKEIESELGESKTDFYRKIKCTKPPGESEGQGSSPSSHRRGAAGNTVPAIPRAATMTDRLRGSHMQAAASALANAARSERSDVFKRRLSGQIASRYNAGKEHPKAERVKIGRMVLEELGLKPADLVDCDESPGAGIDDK